MNMTELAEALVVRLKTYKQVNKPADSDEHGVQRIQTAVDSLRRSLTFKVNRRKYIIERTYILICAVWVFLYARALRDEK